MVRLEQITGIILAAALAIPSYWFFLDFGRGEGGYDKREAPKAPLVKEKSSTKNSH